MIGLSLALDGRHERVADAVEREDVLGDQRAAEQRAERNTEISDDRNDRIAQHVLEDDDALAQALCGGGADVVGAHDFEHGAARQPGDQGSVDRGERDRGQNVGLEAVIEPEERQPMQLQGKDLLQQDSDDEDGHTDGDGRQNRHQDIDERISKNRRNDPGGNSDDDLDDDGEEGQLRGVRQLGRQDLGDLRGSAAGSWCRGRTGRRGPRRTCSTARRSACRGRTSRRACGPLPGYGPCPLPVRLFTGLPNRNSALKRMIVAPKKTSTICRSRRTTNFSIGCLPPHAAHGRQITSSVPGSSIVQATPGQSWVTASAGPAFTG